MPSAPPPTSCADLLYRYGGLRRDAVRGCELAAQVGHAFVDLRELDLVADERGSEEVGIFERDDSSTWGSNGGYDLIHSMLPGN
jgi:hypothetical protein